MCHDRVEGDELELTQEFTCECYEVVRAEFERLLG
jgi:hypothetical protein